MQARGAVTEFAMLRKGDDLPSDEHLSNDEDFPRFKLVQVDGFEAPITNPVPILSGFAVQFAEPADRPLGLLELRLTIEEVFDTTVTIRVTFGVRDWSHDWDDPHTATVRFVVLAD